MNRTLQVLLLGCVVALGCKSAPQQPAQIRQTQSPLNYQRRLHDSPEKSPLRPVGAQFMAHVKETLQEARFPDIA